MSQLTNSLTILLNGGPGSGDWGHSGRPGKVGGSGKGHGSLSKVERATKEAKSLKSKIDKANEIEDKMFDRLTDLEKRAKEAVKYDWKTVKEEAVKQADEVTRKAFSDIKEICDSLEFEGSRAYIKYVLRTVILARSRFGGDSLGNDGLRKIREWQDYLDTKGADTPNEVYEEYYRGKLW